MSPPRLRPVVPHQALLIAFVVTASVFGSAPAGAATGNWQPSDLDRTTASLTDVLALNAKAAGTPDASFAQRRERWTYTNGERRFAVGVAVKNADYRATMRLGAGVYEAGRSAGIPWRADA
ncbi:MAG: hypothetical protein ABI186_09200, partial [Candidatus Elarobacter sp.]